MGSDDWQPAEPVAHLEAGYDARNWHYPGADDNGVPRIAYRRGLYQVVADDMNDSCDRGSCWCHGAPGQMHAMDPPTDDELDAWVADPSGPSPIWAAVDAHLSKHHAYRLNRLPNTLL